jgi:hypothetical protein
MTYLAATLWLGHEFDNFLFATIGEGRNGLQLNVVSVLGRLNLDPWDEAANLANLPKVIATQRLTSLLSALPDPSLEQKPDIIATRLITLLPLQTRSRNRLPQPLIRTHSRALMQVLIIGIYMICLLGTEFVITHFKPTDINTIHASDSSIAPVQTLPTPYR